MRTVRLVATVIPIVLAAAAARATTLRVHVFDVVPSESYAVTLNDVPVATINATPSGAVSVSLAAAAGAAVRLHATGSGAVAPSPPTDVSAAGDSVGCAHLTWTASPEPDVVGYRVYVAADTAAGAPPGAWTDSVSTDATRADVCGLVDGVWRFAVRAINASGLSSVLSVEVRASVSTGDARPPAPPLVLSAAGSASGCIDVAWLPSGDPTVTGYEVGWDSVSATGSGSYAHAIDAGTSTRASVCGLTPGTWYVAVRTRNALGMTSAWSAEHVVTLTATAVAISVFDAESSPEGVALRWDVSPAADAPAGFRIERAADGDATVAVVAPRLDASARAFVDRTVVPGTGYTYWLVARDASGGQTRSAPVHVVTEPPALVLNQNVPNPFNPSTTIRFVVPTDGPVRLDVFDVRGARVVTLVDATLSAGAHAVSWNGRDARGRAVASGSYFCRLVAAGGSATRKMLLVK